MNTPFSEKAEAFRNHRQALSPRLKLETNIPTKILKVVSIDESIETSEQEGKKFAQITLVVDVDTSEGVMQKELSTGSENLVTALEANKIDVGSSFTITKKGEGFHTKYTITEVVNA